MIPAGTNVSSVFIHADPVGVPKHPNVLDATVTTDSDILGLEVCGNSKQSCTTQGLDVSDAILGATGTSYPTNVFGRGMNFSTQADFLVWVVNNRTLRIPTATEDHADQIRIITKGLNPAPGKIIVKKVTNPSPDPTNTAFTFTGDVGGQLMNGQSTPMIVPVGTYHSAETVPPGWALTAIVCDDQNSLTPSSGDIGSATAKFNVDPGETVTCTFTDAMPKLTVAKSSTTAAVTAGGQVIPYTYLVTNTGALALSGIRLSDTNTDAIPICPSTALNVGTSMSCTAQHTATQAEMDAGGNVTYRVTASSNEAPNATDTLSIPIKQSPSMTLKKSSTTSSANTTGQVIPYSYLVTNTGNVTLTSITVSDNNTDAGPSCPHSSLAPGASETCTAQHTVTSAEMQGGSVSNIADASSNQGARAEAKLRIPAFGLSAGGSFVVGDLTVGSIGQAMGKSVYFWGSQWWKNNSLSGGTGPAAFKGFQDSPAKPVCGVKWTSKPGNSSNPPAPSPPTWPLSSLRPSHNQARRSPGTRPTS